MDMFIGQKITIKHSNAILLIDNFVVSPKLKGWKLITVQYFLQNTTSIFQHIDQRGQDELQTYL